MKNIIKVLALINGGYMLVDGVYVIRYNKYIGTSKPGPWANLFYKLNINVFELGPLFIVYGFMWFVFLYALVTNKSWTYFIGVIVSVLTLWYLPIGTLFSVIILITLFTSRQKLGL